MPFEWSAAPQGRVVVAGTALEYACWGPNPGQAPTIVLLHEGLGCIALWKDWPAALVEATGCGVFAYSRAGYGASDSVTLPRPLDYMTREAVQVLGPVMDAAGIRQAILLGHSDGASIAAIYGGSVSDMRVRGLILMAPHFFTESSGLAAIREAGRAYADGRLKDRLSRYHNNVDVAFCGWHDAWTDPDFAEWDVADVIDHWRLPVLAIQGQDDPYGTLAQISEIEGRIYAPLQVCLPENCGHAPHVEARAETLGAVSSFCARLLRLEQQEVDLA